MANRERAAHATTQTFGLALVTAALLAVVILTLVLFDGEDIAMFVILTAIVGGVAFLTWRFDTQWARALGLVGTVLSLGGFFLGFGLFQIFSPIEFVLALVYVLGVLLSLVAGIMAIVAGARHKVGPSPREARVPMVALGLIGIAAVVSVAGFLMTRQTVSAEEAAGATQIDMVAFEFSPESSNVPAGSTILVKNADPFVHDITLDALDIAETVGPGGEVLIDLSTAAPGTYDYVCTLHTVDGEGMVGSIVIEG
jgi:plastocyanin